MQEQPENKGKETGLKKRYMSFCSKHRFHPFTVILVLFLVVILFAGSLWGIGIKTTTTVKSRTLKLGLEDMGELATQAGYFRNIQVITKDKKIAGISIPLTSSKYIFSYDGVIKAGYNFSDIDIYEDAENKVITVTLPEVKVLSCEIDENSLEIYDESRNIYSPLTIDDVNAAYAAIKEEAQQQAIANGLLDNARDNAEMLIRSFLSGTYDLDVYTVVFTEDDHK